MVAASSFGPWDILYWGVGFGNINHLLWIYALGSVSNIFGFSTIELPFVLDNLDVCIPHYSPALIGTRKTLYAVGRCELGIVGGDRFVMGSFC